MKTYREKYYEKMDQLISDRLNGKTKMDWREIARQMGCDYITIYRRRVSKFPEFNDQQD